MNTFKRGAPLPLPHLPTLLSGTLYLQDLSKWTLTDPSLIPQQQEDIYFAIRLANYVLKAGAASYGHTSILVVEARVLRDGVTAAIQAGFNRLCIERDNLVVIQALKGKSHVPWKIDTIIEDIPSWVYIPWYPIPYYSYISGGKYDRWLAL